MLFYFHLDECGARTRDDEGTDLPDLEAARSHATVQARDIMAAEVKDGRLCVACRIDVANEAGTIMDVVWFADALTITGQ